MMKKMVISYLQFYKIYLIYFYAYLIQLLYSMTVCWIAIEMISVLLNFKEEILIEVYK
jgi:hypothetical protein